MPALAILNGCGFVARGFAGEQDHLADILVQAVRHRGLSYVDIIQPCITWGTRPIKWYQERILKISDTYDNENRFEALHKAMISNDRIPIGILFKTEPGNVFASRFREGITAEPLTSLPLLKREDIEKILSEFVVRS